MQFNKSIVFLSCIFGKVVVLVEKVDRLISVLSKFKKLILLFFFSDCIVPSYKTKIFCSFLFTMYPLLAMIVFDFSVLDESSLKKIFKRGN